MNIDTSLRMTLFGSPHITYRDGTAFVLRSRKHVALLVYIAMEHHRPISRDTLLALLWPEADEDAARNNLRVALADLRRAFGAESDHVLHITRSTVHFVPQSEQWLDIQIFRTLLATVQRHTHVSIATCDVCLAHLERAVALYGGAFLHGFNLPHSISFEDWAVVQREQLHQAVLQALDTLAAAAAQRSDHAAHIDYTRRQIALEPWRESAHVQLMRGLWASGQRGAALKQYDVCAEVLARELGSVPSDDTAALREAILRDTGPTPRLGAAEHSQLQAPSFATQPMLPASMGASIGRTAELAELIGLVQTPTTRLLTLVGGGGVGKTHQIYGRKPLALATRRNAASPFALHKHVFSGIVSAYGTPLLHTHYLL